MTVDLAMQLWPRTGTRFGTGLSEVETLPEIDFFGETDTLIGVLSRVVLYNDHHHSFDEVIHQVAKATGCSRDDAEGIAWEVHTRGKALVFEGELIDCLSVSSVLEEIALNTQVMT